MDVYTPNAQNELARIDHRMAWDDAFRDFCKGLEAGSLPAGSQKAAPKPVVMCGDFNVAHQEIDLKNPGPNRGKAGFSDEERDKFTKLLDAASPTRSASCTPTSPARTRGGATASTRARTTPDGASTTSS